MSTALPFSYSYDKGEGFVISWDFFDFHGSPAYPSGIFSGILRLLASTISAPFELIFWNACIVTEFETKTNSKS